MTLNQHASNLIDITVKAFNGDVASISPTDGLSLVDSWLSFLQSNSQESSAIIDALRNLKSELQNDNPNGEHVQRILKALIDQTEQTTGSIDKENQPKLSTLADALEGFSQRANGKIKRDTTDDQAPMTSTVGASALSSDDISNRNGGTISNRLLVDMDDTTGSNGGSTSERLSEDTDNTGDDQGDDYTHSSKSEKSRSDTARVDGQGISGGTGDTDSSQSGGRSQY